MGFPRLDVKSGFISIFNKQIGQLKSSLVFLLQFLFIFHETCMFFMLRKIICTVLWSDNELLNCFSFVLFKGQVLVILDLIIKEEELFRQSTSLEE